MQKQVRDWLIAQGYPETLKLEEMRRGLGSAELWSLTAGPGHRRMVVRVFPPGAAESAEREAQVMAAAAGAGLPVPPPVARGVVGGRPVLVTPFAPGELASSFLAAHPEQAHAVGLAMGEVLVRLHGVKAPELLRTRRDTWIAKGGQALTPLQNMLKAIPDQDRLLHLDYHPNNVFVEASGVTAIIDWENALAGPPHMDLARSRAILRALILRDGTPAEQREVIAALDQGLVEGHDCVAGADPHPALSAAWGLSMTIDDLTAQLGKPGMPFGHDVLAALAVERDDFITQLTRG
jgi:aminoglycoside phosphotransferase (APT) family kinase protein